MTGSYDPRDLPILAELEREFHRMVAAELRTDAAPTWAAGAGGGTQPTPAPGGTATAGGSRGRGGRPARRDAVPAARSGRGATGGAVRGGASPASTGARRRTDGAPRAGRTSRPALSTGRRILGRAVAAGALAGVVGATALATKSVVRGGEHGGPKIVQRAAGVEVVVRPYQGKSCLDVTFAGGVASRCVPSPGADEVAPLSAVTPRGRMVVGLAGSDVARVVVRRAGRRVEVPTRTATDGLRWFSAVLETLPHEAERAATVAPRRSDGHAAGPTVADCTLGSAASCQTAHEHSGAPDVNGP